MAMTRVHLLISGEVQGVCYRATTREEAERLGLKGWVRNLDSGQVEAEIEGPEDLVEETTAGGSGLQNLGDGYYQLNWKTPASYANSCKTVRLNLGEGIVHTALFKFR